MSESRARKHFHLYGSQTTLGWRVIQKTSFDKGENKVAQGVWRRVNDEAGVHIGYQILSAAAHRVDLDLASRPQPVSITMRQMQLNVESSQTMDMKEEQRMERVARGLEPEDAVERTQRKVQVFKFITGAKGDILRLWPKDAAAPLTATV